MESTKRSLVDKIYRGAVIDNPMLYSITLIMLFEH